MKAVAVLRPGEVGVVDIPPPEPREYECLVRVHACGLCNGTDLKIIADEVGEETVEYPCILGHENVGEVVECGGEVKYIEPGDTFLNPIGRLAPGTPYGRMYGAMKDYAIVQDHRAMDELGVPKEEYDGAYTCPVPPEIDPADCGVILTLKEAYSALGNFGFEPGMEVLIYGDGPVGLAMTNFLRLRDAGWVGCIGHHDDRLSRIERVSAPDLTLNSKEQDVKDVLDGRLMDLVIDAVGATAIICEGSQLLKPGGKVGAFGVLSPRDAEISLLELKNHTSVHMLNWPYRENETHDEIVRMALDGTIDLTDYYSHVMPAEQAAEAVRMVKSREALKIILTF
jgi:threonine dehydrogenase-like Zn-dependent dehydrogenase